MYREDDADIASKAQQRALAIIIQGLQENAIYQTSRRHSSSIPDIEPLNLNINRQTEKPLTNPNTLKNYQTPPDPNRKTEIHTARPFKSQ